MSTQNQQKDKSIADLRIDYSQASLSEADTAADPITQFGRWFDEAMHAEVPEANAMSLATVGSNGRPSSRIVLIKQFDEHGFTWFTNYESRKGHDLEEHPHGALLFHWIALERQVRIEGRVEKVSDDESDAYFNSRPLRSRLGAIASAQSEIIASRELLETEYAKAEQKFGDNPPRPKHWGGYRLSPDTVEFWQGRRSRLHDRILYTLDVNGGWLRQRLQP
ncbi:pyridoxamine 5'-phosphate oxidase [Collimonas sp. NPDC087041]|uniref:pyridoxamine 5'-phosphate oxidase n=1 Tax=Collimonas sp. NPDC087041 TaxID=3363960 RepID=UPI003802ABD2